MDFWDGQPIALRERAMVRATRWLAWLADLPRGRRQQAAILMDAVLCVAAVWIALSLRVGAWELFTRPVTILSAVALVLWFPVALRWGIYLSIIRFSGGRTMMGLAAATGIFAIPMVLIFMVVGIAGVPRTMGLLHPDHFSRAPVRQPDDDPVRAGRYLASGKWRTRIAPRADIWCGAGGTATLTFIAP